MARIKTTIWDLASVIYEAVEETTTDQQEIDRLAAEVLIYALDRSLLCAEEPERAPAIRVRRRALGLTA